MGAVRYRQPLVATVVGGRVAEEDDVAVLLVLFEGIPDAFFFAEAVDKGVIGFLVLGGVFADGVVAAAVDAVVDCVETVVFQYGGDDVGNGLVLKQAGGGVVGQCGDAGFEDEAVAGLVGGTVELVCAGDDAVPLFERLGGDHTGDAGEGVAAGGGDAEMGVLVEVVGQRQPGIGAGEFDADAVALVEGFGGAKAVDGDLGAEALEAEVVGLGGLHGGNH